MNRFENWFCASPFWRGVTEKQVLPWLLAGAELGEHVLEIGAGAGAAMEELRRHATRVTSLEFTQNLVAKLAARAKALRANSGASYPEGAHFDDNTAVLRGDATALPFPADTFSAVIAILMLHHLPSREAQAEALRESCRVLRPGGVFLALEIENNWINRIAHIRSTFVPFAPNEVPSRFAAVGFGEVATANRSGTFRIKALRPQTGRAAVLAGASAGPR